MTSTKVLFAGSFDPFTIGHESIVRRALKLFGSVTIGIGHNERKPGEWSVEERLNVISRFWKDEPRVEVAAFTGLTVDFAREIQADALLRGIRSSLDFEYERNLADTNRALAGFETILLYSLPELAFISSSMVRELIHNGIDPNGYIAGDFPIRFEK